MIRVAVKLVIISFLVYGGVYLGYSQLEKKLLSGSCIPQEGALKKKITKQHNTSAAQPKKKAVIQNFQSIIRRDIFQTTLEPVAASIEEKPVVEEEKEAVPTSLNLTLEGTAVGTEKNSRAIILDKPEKEFVILKIGEKIQGATLTSIEWDRVIFEVRGKREVLEMPKPKMGTLDLPVFSKRRTQQKIPEFIEEEKNTDTEKRAVVKKRRRPNLRPHRRVSLPPPNGVPEDFDLDLDQIPEGLELDLDLDLESSNEIKSIEELLEEEPDNLPDFDPSFPSM